MVAQLSLELATIHQLHTTEQSHVQRLTFEGDRLSSQLRDMAGRLNEMTFTRDDAIARAEANIEVHDVHGKVAGKWALSSAMPAPRSHNNSV